MQNPPCHHLAIAQSQIGEVHICPDCGVVHLNLQAISIKFGLDAFSELSHMLSQAQSVIEQAKNTPRPRTDKHPPNSTERSQHYSEFPFAKKVH